MEKNAPKIYVSGEGERLPVETLNKFQLVFGLVKSARRGTNDQQAVENVAILKDEILRRLAPEKNEQKS